MSEVITSAQRAVSRFDEAQAELREFMDDNDEFIDELRRLVDNYNAAVKEASVSVKSELKNSDDDRLVIGQFGALRKRKQIWDGKALAALIPGKKSQLFLTEMVSYEVNVTKLEQLIRQGEVDRDEAYKALNESVSLALLPGCPKGLLI